MQRFIWFFLVFYAHGLFASDQDLRLAGFGSAKYTASDSERRFYNLSGKDSDWSALSKLGLNFSKRMGDQFQGIFQIIGLGVRDDYNVDVDLLHLVFSPNEEIKIIFGKQKLPTLLYSRYRETSFLYHFIDLPGAVYEISPIRNFSGATIRYTHNIDLKRELSAELYGGQGGGTLDYGDFSIEGQGKDLIGFRVDYGSKNLNAYANVTSLSLDTNIVISTSVSTANPAIGGLLGGGPNLPDAIKFDLITDYDISRLTLVSTGFDFMLGKLGFSGEYSILDSSKDEVIRDLRGKYSYYLSTRYDFLQNYQVYYFYMSSWQPENNVIIPIPNDETHVVGFNYMINSSISLKFAASSTYYFGKTNLLGLGSERLSRYYGGLDFVF